MAELRVLPWWGYLLWALLGTVLVVLLTFAVMGLTASQYEIK